MDHRGMRVPLRVRPGASRTAVGGGYPRPDGRTALVVAVTARAVDGRATEAALRAVAKALGVRRSAVTLLTGATSRDKVVVVESGGDDLAGRVTALIERV